MKKRIFARIMIALVLITITCVGATGSVFAAKKTPVSKIKLSKAKVELNVGQTKVLKVKVTPKKALKNRTIWWKSSNKKIVTVYKGRLRAKNPGSAVVRAKVGKKTARCKVTVKSPLKGISLDAREMTLNTGENAMLTINYKPKNTTNNKTATWSSSNPDVAYVENGRVYAVDNGETLITAQVGKHSATCKVTVKTPLRGISLNNNDITINSGDRMNLEVLYDPINTTDDRTVTWSSSNSNVVMVDNGTITARNNGTAYVTAIVGRYSAKCKVTVKTPLKSISLDKMDVGINVGGSITLRVSYNPSNTTDDKTVTWTSSNTKVATVSKGKVTVKGTGSATITAQVGTHTATCKITGKQPLKGISLSKNEMILCVKKKGKLTVAFNPANTTDDKIIKWTSSNEKLATVSKGTVTAHKAGKVKITATVGNKTANCTVVIKNAEKISVKKSVSKQTVTVRGAGHAYADATSYRAELCKDKKCRKVLDAKYSKKKMKFTELNLGKTYYIKVYESKKKSGNYTEYEDSAKVVKVTPKKTKYRIYKSKAAIKKYLEKVVKGRKKAVTFYYSTKKAADRDDAYFTEGSAYFDVPWTGCCGIAGTTIWQDRCNKYYERISINGKKYSLYKVDINRKYGIKSQKKLLKKANSICKGLTGNAKSKVIKMDNYFIKHCDYDYSYSNYSGYDAIVKQKAVCNGYAVGAKLLLNLAGVKCEYVTGPANGKRGWELHAWNIVKVGSKWYSCDFCWDSCLKSSKYLLKGTGDRTFWSKHKLGEEYRTKAWKKAHPMAKNNLY